MISAIERLDSGALFNVYAFSSGIEKWKDQSAGTNDEAKDQVRSHYEAYKAAGVEQVKLIFDTKRIEDIPEAEHIDAAIRFLDGG